MSGGARGHVRETGQDAALAPEQPTDRRRAKGERARRALLEATLAIIEREGIAGVTHRRVTRAAGLPATSAAYHFGTINDLLEATLLFADREAAHALAACGRDADPIAAFSGWLVQDFTDQRPRIIAEYELFLYAARVPAIRPSARRWLSDLTALVQTWTPDRRATRVICAYVDGLLLHALVSGETPDRHDMEATIRALI